MKLDRRKFLALTAGGAASLIPVAGSAEDAPVINCDDTYGVLVDTVLCIGCRKCEWACNQEHQRVKRPLSEFDDKSVFAEHRRPDYDAFTVVNQFSDPAHPDKKYTMKVQCMHCNEPACVSACIVGALHKTPQGPVEYDAWKCIGCRYCMVACPFQIPAYEYNNPADPEVRKCTFCWERIQEGKVPACVEICPNEALVFGTREELIDIAHARMTADPDRYVDHIYGKDEIGGTSWMYLAPIDFKYTELPALPKEPIPPLTEHIQHGIFKSFLPPLALYGLLGLIMNATKEREVEEQEDLREGDHD